MPYYCTLSGAKRQLMESTVTDDAVFWAYVPVAGQRIEDYCGQNFDERWLTRGFSAQVGLGNPILSLNDHPLLALTQVTNGNGDIIPASAYQPLPAFEYPRKLLRLEPGTYWQGRSGASTCPPVLGTWDVYALDAISIQGTWGYVRHYQNCWRQISPTVAGAHAASDTVIALGTSAAGVLDAGNIIRIGSEQMVVVGPLAGLTTSITVKRAYNNTQAAALSGGETIEVFQFDPIVELAAQMLTCAFYVGRNNATGDRVLMPDGIGVQVPVDMPLKVKALLGYPYRSMVRGGF